MSVSRDTRTVEGGNGDQKRLYTPGSKAQADTDRYTRFDDIGEGALNMTWLVQDVIAQGNFYQVFGKYKSGKSLVTMDMCCHLAAGMAHWGGRPIKPCLVVWVAGESLMAVKRRMYAWRLRHEVDGRGVALYLRDRAMYLNHVGKAADLAAEIAAFRNIWGDLPVVVVMDTLATNMEGNENSAEDMQPWCNNFVELVLKPHDATGIVVHHSGHAEENRGRGSSALPGAVDGSLKVSKEGTSPATVTLHPQDTRDNGEDADLHFRIDTYELPFQDNFERQVVAPVLFPLDEKPADHRGDGMGPRQQSALNILRAAYDEEETRLRDAGEDPSCAVVTVNQWREDCKLANVFSDRRYWAGFKKTLQDRDLVRIDGDYVYLL